MVHGDRMPVFMGESESDRARTRVGAGRSAAAGNVRWFSTHIMFMTAHRCAIIYYRL